MVNYDFSNLMETLNGIKSKYNVTPEDLRNIKTELNKFFIGILLITSFAILNLS